MELQLNDGSFDVIWLCEERNTGREVTRMYVEQIRGQKEMYTESMCGGVWCSVDERYGTQEELLPAA